MAKEFTCITRKIEVHLHCHGDDEEATQRYENESRIWNEINDNLYKAANRIMSHYFLNDEYKARLAVFNPRYQVIEKRLNHCRRNKLSQEEIDALRQERKELDSIFAEERQKFLGNSQEHNAILKIIRKEFGELFHGDILDCLISERVKYTAHRAEIKSGECSVPNFRKGMPVPFRIKGGQNHNVLAIFRREDNHNDIYVKFPKGIEWDLHFGNDLSNNQEIVERILSGQYDVGSSSIQQVEKKGKDTKIFLLLVVKIPKKVNQLDTDRVVGVDLGINIPLYVALANGEREKLKIGSRQKFLDVRKRMNAQRIALDQDLRYSTNGGHGRTQKLQARERFRTKERNWVHLQNHIYSKTVIEFAKKHNAGVLQLENLDGFGKDNSGDIIAKYKFLGRYWSYYELQTMIEYKANAAGIDVRYVDPYHTSQTCSFCGHYEPNQRPNQPTFICKNPECNKGKGKVQSDGSYTGISADWNAARNIALSKKIVDRKKK